MSASELAAIETLLFQVLPDPAGFLERAMGELAGRLATPTPSDGPTVVSAEPVAADRALADHNILLSGALGACDCWGQDANCPICAGQGRPGWVDPDPSLYDGYVEPAVRRMRADQPAPAGNAHPTDQAPADQLTVGGRA